MAMLVCFIFKLFVNVFFFFLSDSSPVTFLPWNQAKNFD